MTVRLSTDRSAVVDDAQKWHPIDKRTPRGAKLQLINRKAGVATYGVLRERDDYWTHWAPMPVFED